jgi:hypothetical protein
MVRHAALIAAGLFLASTRAKRAVVAAKIAELAERAVQR